MGYKLKKISNKAENVVEEMLHGMALANPALIHSEGLGVISRKEKASKVGVVSGGGSGHEPAHAGYVGKGMLDAAVAGNVFSSPDPERILEGIHQANGGKGILLVLKNYSGDFMNFTMAADLSGMDGIDVEHVIVKDDVAVEDSTYSTGRRGIAGTVLVHKIAGARAEEGGSLLEVKAAAEKAIQNLRSMGMSMSACTIPMIGKPGFVLGEDEMEIGMGIHGEPGINRTKIKSAKEIAKILLDKILDDYEASGIEMKNSEVALLVNGLGATPLMELYILNGEVHAYLAEKGIRIYKSLVGNYMTALEMAGCSLSLLKLDEELKKLLDAPSEVPGFSVSYGAVKTCVK